MQELEGLSPQDLLRYAIGQYGPHFALVTSFQSEGMVLLDMAAAIDASVRVFTLDTGRLPAETHEMIDVVRKRYGVRVEMVSPDAGELEAMTTRHGANLFYDSVAARKLCCHMRKVRPMERKLAEFEAYAVGLRRGQSAERAAVAKAQEVDGKWKFSPLADWTAVQVEEYAAKNNVPRHPLQARGYPSIGCAPCTRPVTAGEDERAGRWWWETDGGKECGLHQMPTGELRRELDVLIEEVLATVRDR